MTAEQLKELERLLPELEMAGAHFFHHGDCVGADERAHVVAAFLRMNIVIHPSIVQQHRAHCGGTAIVETHEAKQPLDRNRDIVKVCGILIATPRLSKEELRSGTWSTIRYARKADRRIFLINPDGQLQL